MNGYGFAAEREWRFYTETDKDTDEPPDNIQFREANGILVPYLELPIEHKSIKVTDVYCGPTLRNILSRQAATLLVKKSNYPDVVNVTSSSLPFIGK